MKISQGIKSDLKRFLIKRMRDQEEQVQITASHDLSKSELDSITKLIPELKGKNIVLQVDASLLAGVIVKKGSKVIDLSMRGRLQQIKNTLHA